MKPQNIIALLGASGVAVSAVPSDVLQPREIGWVPTGETYCASGTADRKTFYPTNLRNAALEGIRRAETPNSLQDGYPKLFYNDEEFKLRSNSCTRGYTYEYPLMKNGQPYGGGNAGAFRVLFVPWGVGNGIYCGTIWHGSEVRGDNSFERCTDISA
ncbi:hypothetical protein F4779DRAFT_638697 [Xylariaceae sp. FL0662B]|nr:hypothetical protein F4779DRAFT_638697 [Xylariaceae sp. FL0662B]